MEPHVKVLMFKLLYVEDTLSTKLWNKASALFYFVTLQVFGRKVLTATGKKHCCFRETFIWDANTFKPLEMNINPRPLCTYLLVLWDLNIFLIKNLSKWVNRIHVSRCAKLSVQCCRTFAFNHLTFYQLRSGWFCITVENCSKNHPCLVP